MQIQAHCCYSNLQIHHLHEQELEQDELFEWMFPRCRLTPKMLTSIPGFKVDWTLLDISPSTCLGPLAKPVQVHKLLLLLLFSSPESARLHFCPSELAADMLKHQHPAALLGSCPASPELPLLACHSEGSLLLSLSRPHPAATSHTPANVTGSTVPVTSILSPS